MLPWEIKLIGKSHFCLGVLDLPLALNLERDLAETRLKIFLRILQGFCLVLGRKHDSEDFRDLIHFPIQYVPPAARPPMRE